ASTGTAAGIATGVAAEANGRSIAIKARIMRRDITSSRASTRTDFGASSAAGGRVASIRG
ncbi:hypothetical protein, partial [Sphingomonas sp. CCH13-B11]